MNLHQYFNIPMNLCDTPCSVNFNIAELPPPSLPIIEIFGYLVCVFYN